jgi:hypothetical protein
VIIISIISFDKSLEFFSDSFRVYNCALLIPSRARGFSYYVKKVGCGGGGGKEGGVQERAC